MEGRWWAHPRERDRLNLSVDVRKIIKESTNKQKGGVEGVHLAQD
jgi:hypothetical protein